jgi:hypothetical protein
MGKPDSYVPLEDRVPSLGADFSGAVDRALSFDARDRQARIEELRSELGWSDDGVTALPRALRREDDPAARRSRLPWILPLAGIAAIAIAIAYTNGVIRLPEFGTQQADVQPPAPKLDDVKEVPEMTVKTEPDGTAEDDSEPEVPGKYPARYTGEVALYRVAETSPDKPLANCVVGRNVPFGVEVDGATLSISHGGNTYVTEAAEDGTFNFESGLFARKMRYSGKITPEAIAGEFVSSDDRGSCYGKFSAKPVPQ